MNELIEYIARALVDRPEQVVLTASESDGVKVFELRVAPEETGKVIGRDGRTINAIRTLVTMVAQRSGAKVRLEVVDDRRGPAASARPPNAPTESAPSV